MLPTRLDLGQKAVEGDGGMKELGEGKRDKLTLEHSEFEISLRNLDMVEMSIEQLKVVIYI